MQTQTFEIHGMRTEQCADIVADIIRAVQGVKDVNVYLMLNQAAVRFDENLVDVSTMQQAVAHAGYRAVAARHANRSFCCGGCCD